jgi:hypothetical protein
MKMLDESSMLRMRKSSKKKRSKTTEKKYHSGIGSSNSKNLSKNLFSSQGLYGSPVRKKSKNGQNSNQKSKKKQGKQLKRT